MRAAGYYMRLAGMERINVRSGQFVLDRRTRGRYGRRFGQECGGGRSWRGATHSLCRVSKRRGGDRSGAHGGRSRHRKGSRMNRKIGYLGLGARFRRGATVALPHSCWKVSARRPSRPRPIPIASSTCSATSSKRSAPTMWKSRTKQKLVEAAINGMLASLDPHSCYMDAKEFQRHAGADARRIRRPRHRSDPGRRPDQSRYADRRYARFAGRHSVRRIISAIDGESTCRA